MTDGIKSSEKPSPKQTPTNTIFIILSLLCLVTSMDRSIVGGAFSGISSFISNAPVSFIIHTDTDALFLFLIK